MAMRRFCSLPPRLPPDSGLPPWLVGIATVGMGIGGYVFYGSKEGEKEELKVIEEGLQEYFKVKTGISDETFISTKFEKHK